MHGYFGPDGNVPPVATDRQTDKGRPLPGLYTTVL